MGKIPCDACHITLQLYIECFNDFSSPHQTLLKTFNLEIFLSRSDMNPAHTDVSNVKEMYQTNMSKNELGKLIEKGVDATLWHTSC